MNRAAWIAVSAVTASACSLVVGTTARTLVLDGGEDATTAPEAGDDANDGAVTVDAGPPDAPCSAVECFVEAGVCGTSCGVTSANCQTNCKNQKCKDQCVATETACRSACAANCNTCTLAAGCLDQVGCADASAM